MVPSVAHHGMPATESKLQQKVVVEHLEVKSRHVDRIKREGMDGWFVEYGSRKTWKMQGDV